MAVPAGAGSAGVRLAGMEKTALFRLNSTAATRLITTEVSSLFYKNKGSKGDRVTHIDRGRGGGQGLRRWYLYLSSVRGGKGINKWMQPGAREWPIKKPTMVLMITLLVIPVCCSKKTQ
jgi:hypothetical protein